MALLHLSADSAFHLCMKETLIHNSLADNGMAPYLQYQVKCCAASYYKSYDCRTQIPRRYFLEFDKHLYFGLDDMVKTEASFFI